MTDTLKIARRYALWYATCACFVGAFLLFLLGGFAIFSKGLIAIAVAVGVLTLFVAAYFLGGAAGSLIAHRSKAMAAFIGGATGVFVLAISTLSGCMVGFLFDNSSWGLWQDAYDYIVKPIFWISTPGLILALTFGIPFGLQVWKVLHVR